MAVILQGSRPRDRKLWLKKDGEIILYGNFTDIAEFMELPYDTVRKIHNNKTLYKGHYSIVDRKNENVDPANYKPTHADELKGIVKCLTDRGLQVGKGKWITTTKKDPKIYMFELNEMGIYVEVEKVQDLDANDNPVRGEYHYLLRRQI